jgi:hypothetical protein
MDVRGSIRVVFTASLVATPAAAQHAPRHLGASVMPFALARSVHVFTLLADGGTQDIISRDGESAQVKPIRAHLSSDARLQFRGNDATSLMEHRPELMPDRLVGIVGQAGVVGARIFAASLRVAERLHRAHGRARVAHGAAVSHGLANPREANRSSDYRDN